MKRLPSLKGRGKKTRKCQPIEGLLMGNIMEIAENKPRGIFSVVAMGLMFGPILVMLWIGRGKLALLYLLLNIALIVLTYEAEVFGILPTQSASEPLLTSFAVLSNAVFNIIGTVHALNIRTASTTRPWFRWIPALSAALFVILPVLFLARTFLFQPFNIPSKSSEPNLMVGDYLFVSKTAYGYSRFSFPFHLASFAGRTGASLPQRGDMAVFKLPTDTEIDYIKRVVGLPGDRVRMIDGVLNINGVPVKLEPVTLPPEYYEVHYGEAAMTFFRETLPDGHSYVIANMMDNGSADNTTEYVVPAGNYFMLGDNRDNSEDSRFLDHVGYVPAENFIGPVVLLYWNSQGFSLNNRPQETYPSK